MELCNTDKTNALKLIKSQCDIIHSHIDIDLVDEIEIASLLSIQADIINKVVNVNNTRAFNKARMAKRLSKKILKKISNDKE